MKKILFFMLAFIQIGCLFSVATCAEEKSFSWYCKHVKDHAQPELDAALQFIQNYNGFYADLLHADQNDSDKVIYLTFDAGYENGNVAKILDVLSEENVPAAFFVLGHLVTHETELVKRMAKEGHLVCNHTVRHKDMTTLDEVAFTKELKELEALYREKIGEELSPYYRPPKGCFNEENLKIARKLGYATIFWSFAYADWDNDRQPSQEKALQKILENLHNGEVMLLHPTSATNAAILKDLISQIKAQGYRFGTLDELTRRGDG